MQASTMMAKRLTPTEMEQLSVSAGLSATELCRRAGIAYSTLFRWRTGRTQLSDELYWRLMTAVVAAAGRPGPARPRR